MASIAYQLNKHDVIQFVSSAAYGLYMHVKMKGKFFKFPKTKANFFLKKENHPFDYHQNNLKL